MPLTRSFRKTVLARAESDAAFRDGLLTEGVQALVSGDLETGKAVLRDYINATIGFDHLARNYRHSSQKPHAHVWAAR